MSEQPEVVEEEETQITVMKTANQFVVRPTNDTTKIANAVEGARQNGMNVLTPHTWLDTVPKDHRLAVRVINPREGDFWPTGGGKHSPRGQFVLEVSRAAGVVWRDDKIRRIDDCRDPYVCCFEAVCISPDPTTGRPQIHKGTYQLDLRDGSATAEDILETALKNAAKYKRNDGDEKGRAQLRQKRRFIVQLAETGAMLRAARKAIGIRGDYSKEETKKPFVVVSLEYIPGSDSMGERDVHAEMAHQANLRLYYGGMMGLGASDPPPAAALPEVPIEERGLLPPGAFEEADEFGELADDEIPFTAEEVEAAKAKATADEEAQMAELAGETPEAPEEHDPSLDWAP